VAVLDMSGLPASFVSWSISRRQYSLGIHDGKGERLSWQIRISVMRRAVPGTSAAKSGLRLLTPATAVVDDRLF
jgi:hypothetical protein